MNAAFDTLTAARKLESAKFSREQAEAIAKAVRDGQGELATKAGIAALENSMNANIAALKNSTDDRRTIACLLSARGAALPEREAHEEQHLARTLRGGEPECRSDLASHPPCPRRATDPCRGSGTPAVRVHSVLGMIRRRGQNLTGI